MEWTNHSFLSLKSWSKGNGVRKAYWYLVKLILKYHVLGLCANPKVEIIIPNLVLLNAFLWPPKSFRAHSNIFHTWVCIPLRMKFEHDGIIYVALIISLSSVYSVSSWYKFPSGETGLSSTLVR